jgi:hypothetical protein
MKFKAHRQAVAPHTLAASRPGRQSTGTLPCPAVGSRRPEAGGRFGIFLASAAKKQHLSRLPRNAFQAGKVALCPTIEAATQTSRKGGTEVARGGAQLEASFERSGGQVVLMWKMKAIKKTKKSLVGIKAMAPEPVHSVPVQSAALAAAGPAPAKSQSPRPARVSLELVEPAAQQVYVAGSFNGWKPDTTPLAALGNGRWKGDLKLGPGRYEYLFVVDGQWRPDPNARETVQNPFGGRNSVVMVSE